MAARALRSLRQKNCEFEPARVTRETLSGKTKVHILVSWGPSTLLSILVSLLYTLTNCKVGQGSLCPTFLGRHLVFVMTANLTSVRWYLMTVVTSLMIDMQSHMNQQMRVCLERGVVGWFHHCEIITILDGTTQYTSVRLHVSLPLGYMPSILPSWKCRSQWHNY